MSSDPHPRGPEAIKAAKRALGVRSVDDLLALNQRNDPYYCGIPFDRARAEWFARLWHQFGRACTSAACTTRRHRRAG